MYRSFILLAPKRLTFGQRWKFNRIKNSIKNKNNNPYIVITQCDTIEKINKIQKLIDKQKKLISPAPRPAAPDEKTEEH